MNDELCKTIRYFENYAKFKTHVVSEPTTARFNNNSKEQ